jgi:hypothetical protein
MPNQKKQKPQPATKPSAAPGSNKTDTTDKKIQATDQPADTNVNASHRMPEGNPSRSSIETSVSDRP